MIPQASSSISITRFFNVFSYTKQAVKLVWQTSKKYTLLLAIFTVVAGILPSVIAYYGQLIVDGVIAAQAHTVSDGTHVKQDSAGLFILGVYISPILLWLVLIEAVLAVALMSSQRVISIVQSLFRGLLGFKVNSMILQKALTLSLTQFEDSEFYDKLVRARRQASTRPLGLVNKTFALLQNAIGLVGFSILLLQFSPVILLLLFLAALPAFFTETYFSEKAFTLFKWRSPESRAQNYLETLLAREDNAKEIKLLGLGKLFLTRYTAIFNKLYKEDKLLTLRRDIWGAVMDVFSVVVFYGAFIWVIIAAVKGDITIGQMTMYLVVFKQARSAIKTCLTSISGMYEDNLYLSNLYEYLDQPGQEINGTVKEGIKPNTGFIFENVSFTYEGAATPALYDVSFSLQPGDSLAIVGENGSGKTTLIKLLTRLYSPSSGVIYFDGTPLEQWDSDFLYQKIGVIFQDFIRYQLLVGENIGVGLVNDIDNADKIDAAAQYGQADAFIKRMKDGYNTQLGRWFKGGQELSGGQWQKIALARAFMRNDAQVLILDEPTAAMDAQAEADIFEQFKDVNKDKMTVLISHRFSTVRTANKIMVMEQGRIIELGDHASLLKTQGTYANLFELQAKGYV